MFRGRIEGMFSRKFGGFYCILYLYSLCGGQHGLLGRYGISMMM